MKASREKSTTNQCREHVKKCIQWVALILSHLCWLSNLRNSPKIRNYSSSRSSKVIDLDVHRTLICNILLVINKCLDVYFAIQAEHKYKCKYKYRIKIVKTTKRRNRQYRTDEQTRRESTNTSIQKVQNYTLFEQTTKVNVNKLLHSTYGVSVTKFDL